MSDSTSTLRLAQIVGITATSAMAGASFAISAYATPRLLESPSPLMLRQWKNLYESGKATMPPMSLLTTAIIGYLAYDAKGRPGALGDKWKLYALASALNIAMVPYTLTVMASTNNKLLTKAGEIGELKLDEDMPLAVGVDGETPHQLVDKWATLNVGRALLLGAAAALTAWTTLA